MPSLARRVARRYLPHSVRRAGLILVGKDGPPVRSKPKKKAGPKDAKRPATPQPTAGQEPLVLVLRRGGSLTEALVAETRHLLSQRQRPVVTSLGSTLLNDATTAQTGDLVLGISASSRNLHALAWQHLGHLPDQVWTQHAAREWVRAGLNSAPEDVLERVKVLARTAPDFVPPSAWLDLIGAVFGYGDQELVRELFAVLDAQVGDGSHHPRNLVVQRDWLRRWVAASPEGASAPVPPAGEIPFALLTYGHPGRSRASANIGDHVQSLASVGHLVRHQDVEYTGPQDLVDVLTRLRGQVPTELQRTGVSARVQLLQVDRDASMYSAVPPNTWTLAFGWYMHAIFESRYGFPFHPNLLPIFISFHCNKRDLLVSEAVEYLRRFAPIGCRDWTTVDILLSAGVPAFFSGCMTTTVRTVFPEHVERPGADAPVAYVDVPAARVPSGARTYKHSNDRIRFRSFARNLTDAIELLEDYRTHYRGLVTSRLHCYLPVRSLGVPVDFQPGNRSDPRFAGLIDITDAEFTSMQTTIDARLEQVIEAVLAGTPAEQVYALWREINADDVAAAQARRAADRPLAAPLVDLDADIERVRATVRAEPSDALPVVIPLQPEDIEPARVLLRTVAAHTTSTVQFFLLTRNPEAVEAAGLAAEVPGHQVEVLSTLGVGDDVRAGGGRSATADLDRLLLPQLLQPFDRVLVLPARAVVSGDIAELLDLDLEGFLLAAPATPGRSGDSGFRVLEVAASRLRDQTAAATELRRRAYARHRFDFDAFDVSVLVMDLAACREDEVLRASQSYLEEFGLSHREVLHLAAGPNRAPVPDRWHQVPGRSPVTEPALVHWAEAPLPWGPDAAAEQARWFAARDAPAGAAVGMADR